MAGIFRLKDLELTEEQSNVLKRLQEQGVLTDIDFNKKIDWESCISSDVVEQWIALSQPEIVVKRAKEMFFSTLQGKVEEYSSIKAINELWEHCLKEMLEAYRYRSSGERFIKSGLAYCMSNKENK